MPQLQYAPDWASLTATNLEKVKRGMNEREIDLFRRARIYLLPRPWNRNEPVGATDRRCQCDSPVAGRLVIDVEPGIHKPGVCGLRLEETVLVTDDGNEVLTKTGFCEALLA